MSLFDTLKSTVMGAMGQNGEILGMLNQLLSENGGVSGLSDKFNAAGLGETVKSWIGTGQNLPISAEQIQKVLGSTQIQGLATKFGVDTTQVATQLASGLPSLIDKLSPDGKMPSMDQIADNLKSFKNLMN